MAWLNRRWVVCAFCVILCGGGSVGFAQQVQGLPDNWQQLSLADLSSAAQAFYNTSPSASARAPVAAAIWNQDFVDNTHFETAFEADYNSTYDLLVLIEPDVSSDVISAMVQTLTATATNSQSLAALDFQHMHHINVVLKALSAPQSTTQQMALNWMNASNNWTTLPDNWLTNMVEMLSDDKADNTSAAQTSVAAQMWTNFLSNPSQVANTNFRTIHWELRVMAPLLSADQRATLASELAQRYANSPADLAALPMKDLAWSYLETTKALGCTDQQMLTILKSWAQARDARSMYSVNDGEAEPQYSMFERFFTWPANPSTFGASFMQQLNGAVSGPTTAKFLVYAADAQGNLASLMTSLAAQSSGGGLSGDAQALVLLEQAIGTEVQSGWVGRSDPLPLAQQALAAAQSTKLKLACAQWIVDRMVVAGDYTDAQALVTQTTNGMQDSAALAQFANLSTQITNDASANQAAAQVATLKKVQQLQGQLASLQSQLQQAQSAGKSDQDLQAIQTLIANTQQAIQSATQPSQ